MFDLGPMVAVGARQLNSPYHSIVPDFRGVCWNTLEAENLDSGLVDSDGAAVAGVTLRWGRSIGSTAIDFSHPPTDSRELGQEIRTGVFAGTSIGRDALFSTSRPAGNHLIGLKIGGLNPGRYDLYLVGVNLSNAISHQREMAFFVASGQDASTFETKGLKPAAMTRLTPRGMEQWIEGESYAKTAVKLKAGETLFVAAGQADGQGRGFLNAIQLVARPEPKESPEP